MVVTISILLALAVGGSPADPQAELKPRRCFPPICLWNHNETLVRDTASPKLNVPAAL